MADRLRVVIDLDLRGTRPQLRELAWYLAQAVENFQTAHGGDPITVAAIRAPEEEQTFRQARELYEEVAFRRWQQRHGFSPP